MPVAKSVPPVDFRGFPSYLQALAAEADLPLAVQQTQQLAVYARALAETNRKFNLTALDQPADIAALHILDSVLVLDALTAEVEELQSGSRPLSLADLGTGGGLPGIPIKVMWPAVSLTLVDGSRKKVRFLTEILETLGLPQAQAVQGRAEDLAHRAEYREQYDLVVVRGLARFPTLLEYAVPWLRTGGLLLAYKGPGFPAELHEARRALRLLQATVERVIPVHIPGRDVVRLVAAVRKTARTPRRYPRPRGLPRKEPL